ncbi:MAG: nuclear transport factor 2 family protein [Steroidobacteraceae bacterium]
MRNTPVWVALAMTALLLDTAGCASVQSSDSLADLEATERARFTAQVRVDVEALQPLLADDLVYCHTNALCQTKAEFIDTLRSRTLIYKSVEVIAQKSRSLAPGVAVINGKLDIQGELNGQPVALPAVYTAVWLRRDGRWQLTAWQSTRAP